MTLKVAPTTTGFEAKWLKASNLLDAEDFDLDKAVDFFAEEFRSAPADSMRRSNLMKMVDWLNELKQLRGYQNQPPFARKLQKLSDVFLGLAERFDNFAYRDWRKP